MRVFNRTTNQWETWDVTDFKRETSIVQPMKMKMTLADFLSIAIGGWIEAHGNGTQMRVSRVDADTFTITACRCDEDGAGVTTCDIGGGGGGGGGGKPDLDD